MRTKSGAVALGGMLLALAACSPTYNARREAEGTDDDRGYTPAYSQRNAPRPQTSVPRNDRKPGAVARTGDPQWSALAVMGGRRLDGSEFAPVNEPDVFGVQVDYRPDRAGNFGATFQLVTGWESDDTEDLLTGTDIEADLSFLELSGGVKAWANPNDPVRPFSAVGLAINRMDAKVEFLGVSEHDTDTGAGLWIALGMEWEPSDNFLFSLEARTGWIAVDFGGGEANAMGLQYTLGAGWSW